MSGMELLSGRSRDLQAVNKTDVQITRSGRSSSGLRDEHPDWHYATRRLVSRFRTDNIQLANDRSCVTLALMFVAAGPMALLANRTPDRIPADVIVEQIVLEHQQEKAADLGKQEE
jgi:hypothetical protein